MVRVRIAPGAAAGGLGVHTTEHYLGPHLGDAYLPAAAGADARFRQHSEI